MKKILRLSESDLIKIVKKIIKESTGPSKKLSLLGRDVTINSDGTISILNKKNQPQKIRIKTSIGPEINVQNITPSENGFIIQGKKMSKEVGIDVIEKVFKFPDTNSPTVIKSGDFYTPNLLLTKV